MRKLHSAATLAVLAGALGLVTAAHADGNPDGHFQIKVLATDVIPDGSISSVKYDPKGLTTGANTTANDNVVPTLAVEYFFTPNISVETICCFTSHHVTGTGALAGAGLVDHLLVLPATITAKYHVTLPGGIKPYIGAGPTMFFIFNTRPGSTAQTLGVTSVNMSDNIGGVVQAGVDIPVNKTGMGISLDAKKYWVSSTATFYAGSTEVLSTVHHIDPWVLSAGVTYRF